MSTQSPIVLAVKAVRVSAQRALNLIRAPRAADKSAVTGNVALTTAPNIVIVLIEPRFYSAIRLLPALGAENETASLSCNLGEWNRG